MWSSKDIYYISGSTGILAEDFGKALISQFPDINFIDEKIPFIKTVDDAKKALLLIQKQSGGRYPIIISTIMSNELNDILDIPEFEFLNVYNDYLIKFERILETKSLRQPGYSRQRDSTSMGKRVEAIKFCLNHDDGVSLDDYHEAEIILLGVSRSGKTPISVYLGTQMEIKTANYPLVQEDLDQYRLPVQIARNKHKAVGLTTTPEILHEMREKRYKNSNYASLANCKKELKQANDIFMKYNIPIIISKGTSIEEAATQVSQSLSLGRRNL